MDLDATAAVPAAFAPVSLPAFASGFALRARQTAWLLGAGASADAGVPTAGQIIDDLLAVLFCREHGLRRSDLLSDPRWRGRVRLFYDGRHGLPSLSESGFYSAVFEMVYPDRDARARFVMDKIGGRGPHVGQHVLAALVSAGLAPVLITTNFDTLLEDAIRPTLDGDHDERLTVLDPESATRAAFAVATDVHPLLIKIHGDLGAVTVKNTSAELAEQDVKLRASVLGLLGRYGLIVVGYSGRDPAVMAMLHEVLRQPMPFPGGLTWVRRPEDLPGQEVQELLQAARNAGVEPVHEVEASGMMELMAEIERAVDLPPQIAAQLAARRPVPLRTPAPPPHGPVSEYPQVRLAALPLLTVPTSARLLSGPKDLPLSLIRQALRTSRARAVVARRAGGQLVAFGNDAALATALAAHGVRVTDAEVPITTSRDGEAPDSTDAGLLAEALARALGRTRGITEVLRTGQRHLLRARDEDPRRPQDTAALAGLRRAVGGPVTGYLAGPAGPRLPWAEAITLAIEWREGAWRLLFAPDVWVRHDFTERPPGMSPQEARAAATQLGAKFVRERVARRYNSTTGRMLGGWLRLLTAGDASGTRTVYTFGLPAGAGMDAAFSFGCMPLVSRELKGGALRSNT